MTFQTHSNRISPSQAQIQIDLLLLAGSGIANTVSHTPDALVAFAEEIRSNYTQIEEFLPNYKKLAAEMFQSSAAEPCPQIKCAEYNRLHAFLGNLYNQAVAQHEILIQRVNKFENHVQFVAMLSRSAAKEGEPFIEKLKESLIPLATQRETLNSALSHQRT